MNINISDKPKLHVHVWSENQEEIDKEYEMELTGDYGDYLQFGAMVNGRWLEIRLAKEE